MAKASKDYFGMDYILSLILAIFPLTSWVLGFVTRFQEGKIVAGLLRVFVPTGVVIWILDIIFMITRRQIFRLLNL